MFPIKANNLKITSNYGNRTITLQGKTTTSFHHGLDLVPYPVTSVGEIVAFADGVVTAVSKVGKQWGTPCYVRIKHDNGLYTLYYHLKSNSIVVNKGQKVTKGQKLGMMGTTGQSSGIHLHFQVDDGNSVHSINPYDYIFANKEFIKKSFLHERGYYRFGDCDENIGKIAEFMYKTFPKYTKKEALGNYFGKNLKASITEFQKRTKLSPDGCIGKITLAKLKEFGFQE